MSTSPEKRDPLSDLPAGQSADQVGVYHWDINTGLWSWSSEIYLMFGYQPGTVVPSLELLRKHGHPRDRRHLADVFGKARRTAEPFSGQHRIVAADGGTVMVVVVGDIDQDEHGAVTRIHGYFVDLTTTRTKEAEQLHELADEAAGLQRALRSRATIEQAKGMIMLAYACGSAEAFDVLIDASQRGNIKLRELSERLVAAVQTGTVPERAREHLEAALLQFSRPDEPTEV